MCYVCRRFHTGEISARQAKVLLWTAIECAKTPEDKTHIQDFYTELMGVIKEENNSTNKMLT